MTRVSSSMQKPICILILFLSGLAGRIYSETYPPTNEIISNNIYYLDGRGDTLWMLTSKGVNYTTSILDSPIIWRGNLNVLGESVVFSKSNAVICLSSDPNPNMLWIFNFNLDTFSVVTLPYNISSFDSLNSSESFEFEAVGTVWFKNAYWVACKDGGLIKLEPPSTVSGIYYPGDTKLYTFKTFIPDSNHLNIKAPDRTKRIIAVAADSLSLWLCCEKALWSFSPLDSLWLKINDSAINAVKYFGFEMFYHNNTTKLFVVVSVKEGSDTNICIYMYNAVSKKWNKFINNAENVRSLAIGAKNHIYVLDDEKNNILIYKDSLSDTNLAPDVPYGQKIEKVNGNEIDFVYRIQKADEEVGEYEIQDINYSIAGNDTLFQVATDIGLFYSNNEHYDELHNIVFKFAYRSVDLLSNLEKTYAIPGIINNYRPEAVFAYNLSKDDKVTIDIFDYNNDFVARVIDNAPRLAGSHRTSGRSTVPQYDKWDGTAHGKVVPPGVYIYRIKTKSGKTAFGKIIVAKN